MLYRLLLQGLHNKSVSYSLAINFIIISCTNSDMLNAEYCAGWFNAGPAVSTFISIFETEATLDIQGLIKNEGEI